MPPKKAAPSRTTKGSVTSQARTRTVTITITETESETRKGSEKALKPSTPAASRKRKANDAEEPAAKKTKTMVSKKTSAAATSPRKKSTSKSSASTPNPSGKETKTSKAVRKPRTTVTKTKSAPGGKAPARPKKTADKVEHSASSDPAPAPAPPERGGMQGAARGPEASSTKGSSNGTGKSPGIAKTASTRGQRMKQTARCIGRGGRGGITSTRGGSEVPRFRTPQTARRGRGFPALSNRATALGGQLRDNDGPPPPYSEFPDGLEEYEDLEERESELEDYNDPEDERDNGARVPNYDLPDAQLFDRFTAIYTVDCPLTREEWPDYSPEDGESLRLLYSPSTGDFWGSYDLGMFTGFFRTSSAELRENGEGLYARFRWRGREEGDNHMSFGPQCTGFVKVTRGGRVLGAFSGMYGESVEFEGRRETGHRSMIGSEAEFRAGYERLNEQAYEYERVARWR